MRKLLLYTGMASMLIVLPGYLVALNYLHRSIDHKIIIRDPNFSSTNIRTLPGRAAVLALTWNFGKLTESVTKKKGVNNDDLLSQPAAPTGNQ
ncbi:MAG TPA: hypothetical protein VMY77_18500 [Chitinophagaceae bacterium]|nr:hypothetical protein [Chitinophagaceae bacterium]